MNWLQPAPDAVLTPDSADPAAIVAAREGLRLALIASLQYLPPRQDIRQVPSFGDPSLVTLFGFPLDPS